jgi:hypothetical protein
MVVHYNLGEPRLIACEPIITSTEAGELSIHPQGKASGNDLIPTNRPDYRGPRPKDILPGDWLRVGTQGNLIAVLEGGTNILRSSFNAQVVTSREKDLVKIHGRNVDIFSDFGELKFENEGGQTSFTLRGGSQQLNESSPLLDENFTIALDLGAKGDVYNFRITNQRGIKKYNFHIDAEGNVTSRSGYINEVIVGDKDTHLIGSKQEDIEQDLSVTVGGNTYTSINGNSARQVLGDSETLVGNNLNASAGKDVNINATRTLSISAGGDTTPKPSSRAIKVTAINGSVEISIGDPGSGDKQTAKSGFILKTFTGNIELNSKLGKIILNSPRPDSIVLGGKTATFHAVLFEQLKAFFEVFGNLIDTHVHATAVGPSSPPAVPPFQTSRAQLELAKSHAVVITK